MAKREDKPTTYTVTFDANGHGTAPDQQTITSGGKVTEPTAPTAEGYTFGGWYTDSACTTAWDFDNPVTESITLYAKWTEDTSGGGESGDTTYTVTFAAGEGSGTMDAVTVNSGAEYTLPACTFTAPSGKEFKAWSVDGAENAVGDKITVSTDTTVTALWKDAAPTTYTITIADTINYGTVTTNKETAAAGDTVTLTVTPAVGYGLNTITANNGEVTLTPATANLTKYTFTMPESNVTVTADFIKISVTIKSGDTDVTNQEIQLHAGKTVQLTEAVTPANASYNGAVWYSDSDSVAAVKQDGKVTAVNEGTAVITVQVGDVSASCKVKVDAHDWEYTVDESQRNTVKVSCTVDGCGLNGAVSISADGGTYNGQPYNAELRYSDDWLKSVVNNISYEYRRTETESFLFTTDTTKAGFYRAKICKASSNNLHGAETGAYVEYTIAPKSLIANDVTLGNNNLIYNGTQQTPTITVKDGDKTLTQNTDYTVSYQQNDQAATPANAGSYDVVITGKGNYTGTVKTSFTIDQLSLKDATVTLSDNVIFKGGNAPTVTVTLNGNTVAPENYTAAEVSEDGIVVTVVVRGQGNYKEEPTAHPTYLVVDLPDPDDVQPDDKSAIDAYEQYEKLSETYKNAELEKALGELREALTDYEIIKGHKSTYVKGSYKNLTLTANGYHGKFTGIEVDGELLHPTHYSVEKGSTVITLKYAYLESLKSGKHYVQVNYTDGSTDGDDYFRIAINNGSPITADGSHIHGFALLGLATMLLMCFILALKTRKKGRFER